MFKKSFTARYSILAFIVFIMTATASIPLTIEPDIKQIDKLEPVETTIDTLSIMAHAFAMVESTDNPLAYNETSGAAGWLQMKKIMVREANRLKNLEMKTCDVWYYTYEDRYNKEKSREMFVIIMTHRNPKHNIETACKIWNYTHTQLYEDKVNGYYNDFLTCI